jgi:UDP-N-acetylmuramoyl-tripeptide--D-alanyl-D-alanine ligase
MNHPGELDPLCEILTPDLSIVTCVGPVHIENFENEAGIALEKAAVYRGLNGRGIAVINADDAYAGFMRSAAQGNRIVEVSSEPGADFVYRRIDPAAGLFEITEKLSGEVVELKASLPGAYFVLDAALAAAAARVMGVPWPVICNAVQFYQPLSMRWNLHTWFGMHTVNDAYNANPVSIRAAVQAFMEEPAAGKRWLVLGGMLELGADEQKIHREAGAAIAHLRDVQLVTVGMRGAWLAEGAAAAGKPAQEIHIMPDHESAARLLDAHLVSGDALLLKASRGESVERVLEIWKQLRQAKADT